MDGGGGLEGAGEGAGVELEGQGEGVGGRAEGTRTEAGQKVPQAKPERAPSIRGVAEEPNVIEAVGPSMAVPARPAVTIRRPSPV